MSWTGTSMTASSHTCLEQERFHCANIVQYVLVRNRVFDSMSGRLDGTEIQEVWSWRKTRPPPMQGLKRDSTQRCSAICLSFVLETPLSGATADEIIVITLMDPSPEVSDWHAIRWAVKPTLARMLPKSPRYRVLHARLPLAVPTAGRTQLLWANGKHEWTLTLCLL